MITPKNITRHELIGQKCTVLESTDPSLAGTTGRVVWETRNILHIESGGRVKKVPKENSVFSFQIDGEVRVEGSKIVARPEDRIKRR